MKNYFKSIFNETYCELVNNDYYFNSDKDGDNFDEADANRWLNESIFKNRWNSATQANNDMFQCFNDDILRTYSKVKSPFLEIACGPGMGLTPVILSKYPQVHCLVTDACSLLIKCWRKYINEKLSQYNIDLASFSVLNMPIKNNSIEIVTSFIGISSTRAGEQGKEQALNEVFRILKDDGYFIAVENEWSNYDAIKEVFKLWNKPIWSGMKSEKTWQEGFTDCGFTIESCDKPFFRYLRKDDNDLGEQAEKFGIKIGLKYTLFILQKHTK